LISGYKESPDERAFKGRLIEDLFRQFPDGVAHDDRNFLLSQKKQVLFLKRHKKKPAFFGKRASQVHHLLKIVVNQ
jgi:hypothetical protein